MTRESDSLGFASRASAVGCLVMLCGILVLPASSAEPTPWQRPQYTVMRVAEPLVIDGKLGEPSWMGAPAVTDFQFPWWRAGEREPTVAKLLWDDRRLYVACICQDRHITARTKERDGPVAQDDCFEIMVSPDPQHPEVYFNIEWNVLGGILDNHRPHGPQKPRAPKWDAEGIEIAGSFSGTLNQDDDVDQFWIVEVAIPFANFRDKSASTPPQPDSFWLANLNRHGGSTNPQFSQWSAGDTPTPSFHTPHRFGQLVFSSAVVGTGQARRYAIPPVEAVARMSLPPGVMATPFAAEPEIRQPNLVKCDDRGRLWVIQYLQYPNPAGLQRVAVDRWSRTTYDRVPEPPPHGPRGADRITICEDTDLDGRADRFRDFVDGLNLCTGLAFGHGGVYVLQVPYLLFYPDRNRDDVPDSDPEVLLAGFGMEDAQSFANHLTWGPDGWLYGVNGSTTTCQVRGTEFQQGVWRYHPVTKAFELYCEGGGNLFGLTFDEQGQMFFTSNGGHLCMHGMPGANYQKAFNKHGPLHHRYAYGYFSEIEKRTPVVGGPCTGGTIYLGDGLPPSFRGSFLCGDFLGHTSSWWRLESKGASYTATREGSLMSANDPWFGATDVTYGPDGAVYICDFHDQRTAHPDPDAQWDRATGRVYRLSSIGLAHRPTTDLRTATDGELLATLGDRNGFLRERARVLLSERGNAALFPVLRRQVFAAENLPLALASLWTLYGSGGFDRETAASLLQHPQEPLRIWGVRLLSQTPELATQLRHELVQLATREERPLARAELATAARRFPPELAWLVLETLLDRDLDHADPHIPWLLWWSVERLVDKRAEPLWEYFTQPSRHHQLLSRRLLPLLVRRAAVAGTPAGDSASLRLLQSAPPPQREALFTALVTGWKERSATPTGIGQGELFRNSSQIGSQIGASPITGSAAPQLPHTNRPQVDVSDELKSFAEQAWSTAPTSGPAMRAALHVGVADAYSQLLRRVADQQLDEPQLLEALTLLAEFGRPDCLPAVAARLTPSQPPPVQLAAAGLVLQFGDAVLDAKLLEQLLESLDGYPQPVRQTLWMGWLSRPRSAQLVLQKVDQAKLPPQEIPLEALRRVASLDDDELDGLVRKHWGKIEAGTPEEKLAIMRRLNNDLRAATGNPQAGKELFKKHCAICHQLFGQGEKIGPDLTNSSRKDLEFLLASLVDPSAIVRREYLATTLVLSDGRVLTGLVTGEAGGELTLVDSQGKKQQFPRRLIEEERPAATSVMPEGLPLQLPPQELRDLIRYLQSDP